MARILLIDDNAANLKLATLVLESAQHTVVQASDGASGLQALGTAPLPDLVLLDVQMPGLSGLDVLQRIRQNANTAGLRVVALTALAMKGDAEKLLAAGFDACLTKPFHHAQLIAQVAHWLAQPPAA